VDDSDIPLIIGLQVTGKPGEEHRRNPPGFQWRAHCVAIVKNRYDSRLLLTNTSLWRTPLEGGQATKVLEGLSNYLNLAIVDEGIYFVPQQGMASEYSIQFLNLGTKQINRIANFEKPLDMFAAEAGLAISPDNRWVLYTQVDQAGAELRLVENFR